MRPRYRRSLSTRFQRSIARPLIGCGALSAVVAGSLLSGPATAGASPVAGTAVPVGANTVTKSATSVSGRTYTRLQSMRLSTPVYQTKYSQSITSEQFSSPAVTQWRGATYVIAGFPNGHLYAWNAVTHARVLDRFVGAGAILGSPTVIDIDRNGSPDIVVTNTAGDILGMTLTNKTIFRAKTGMPGHQPGNFSTTAVSDVNRDGRYDIIQTSWDHYLHIYDGRYLNTTRSTRELPGFPYFAKDTIWSSPVVVDINRDGRPDVVFGYDCDGVQGQPCYQKYNRYNRGGYVTAINTVGPYAGKPVYGWPVFIHNQTVWSSPAIADLDRDGRPDVIVGTGNMLAGGHAIYAFNAVGKALKGWPVTTSGRVSGSPAVGDLDGDGKKEVADTDDQGYLYIFNSNGTLRTKKCISNSGTGCGPNGPRLHTSPIIANPFGEKGRQQVIVGGEQHLYIVDAASRVRYSGLLFWSDRPVRSVPYQAAPSYAAVPGVVSTIFVAAGDFTFGEIFGWNVGTSYSASTWPTFHRGFNRLGIV